MELVTQWLVSGNTFNLEPSGFTNGFIVACEKEKTKDGFKISRVIINT